MNDLTTRLAPHVRAKYRTTAMLEEDLKQIKRLNNLFAKLEKSDKDETALEVINAVKILGNTFHLGRVLHIIYEIVEVKYHGALDLILVELYRKSQR